MDSFSGGQRRRLEIARALVPEPRVLFLDEPTVGLDTRIRYELLDLISGLRGRTGMTTVLTTHYLDEAERLCDRIAVMHQGTIVALDRPGALLAGLGAELIELRVEQDPAGALAAMRAHGLAAEDAFAVGSTLTVPAGSPRPARSLDPHQLAKDFGVPAVHLNGPRFWTLDQIAARAAGEVLSFGGLTARRVAELPIPPGLDLAGGPGGRYYRDITIRRETEWIFAAGRPAYELLTPDGKTYVMQAYSHIADHSLTLESLPALGDRLHLPEGWQYRARTPDRDLTLRTVAGAAHVLQDELQNTYMRLMTV